ncbi:nucleotidyltransferase, partial [bacterium 210820-DFI.6.38]|nr:nucleotidyltransferase [bacterium 210820-DFI.6.38]
ILKNTLSENGGVTRGICTVDQNDYLQRVTETYEIQMKNGVLTACNEEKQPVSVNEDMHVSMNMWGLPPAFLDMLAASFSGFLDQLGDDGMKKEYLLPKIIDKLLSEKRARVKVLETNDKWFGVTYKEDKAAVSKAITSLIERGLH